MRRFVIVLAAANAALALLVAATFATDVGGSRRSHDVAYLALVALALAGSRLLRRRRVTTMLLATSGAWTLLTGVWLVYVTPYVGHGRWMEWWHGVASVAFLLAFIAHWARNSPRLLSLGRRLAADRRAAAVFASSWAAVGALGAATWWGGVRGLFTNDFAFFWCTVALGGAAVAVEYAVLAPRRAEGASDEAARHRTRAAIDWSLLPAAWLAALTGLALLYLARALRAADAYWLAVWWHLTTSALLAGLVALHLSFNARILRAHARRLDEELKGASE